MVSQALKEDILAEYEELIDLMKDFFTMHGISGERFLWGHKLLLSRAMTFVQEGKEEPLMVLGPGQDIFNHSIEAVGKEDVKLEMLEGKETLVIRAFRAFQTGEQAFYSYSPASNGRLLLMGGFVLPENPYDSVELVLTFPVTPATASKFSALAESRLEKGYRPPGACIMEATEDEFLELQPLEEPKEAALHVRLMLQVLHGQIERLVAFLRLDELCRSTTELTADDLNASDGDLESRRRCLLRLRKYLEAMLAQYDNSLEDDEAAIDPAAGTRYQLALQVLLGEKRIFRKALEAIDEKLV